MNENCTNFRLFGKRNADIVLDEGCANSENWSNKNIGWNREENYFIVGSLLALLALSVYMCIVKYIYSVHTGSHSITGSAFAFVCFSSPHKLADDSDSQILAMHSHHIEWDMCTFQRFTINAQASWCNRVYHAANIQMGNGDFIRFCVYWIGFHCVFNAITVWLNGSVCVFASVRMNSCKRWHKMIFD